MEVVVEEEQQELVQEQGQEQDEEQDEEQEETRAQPAAESANELAGDSEPANESTADEQPRMFRSGKGPAEQAYDTFLKELGKWKVEQEKLQAQQREEERKGKHRKVKQVTNLELDSSGSDTDLEDANDYPHHRHEFTPDLEKLYHRACDTYKVTALSQFKYQLKSKQLTVTQMSLNARDVAAMCTVLQHKNDLTYIGLPGNLIGRDGLNSLLNVAKDCKQLTTLDVSSNNLGGQALALLNVNCDCLRNLRSLNLADNGFLERDADQLAGIIQQLENLRHLDASHNSFGSYGGEAIAEALRSNSTIETVALRGCLLRMQGAVAIGNALKDNATLDVLDVSGNGFSDLGATAVAKAMATNTTLAVLNLNSNRIFIDGARALGDMLAVNEYLKELHLDHNSITAKGAELLVSKLRTNENSALKVLELKTVSVAYRTAAAAVQLPHQPLLLRFESFVSEPGSLKEQLDIPNGGRVLSLNPDQTAAAASSNLSSITEDALRSFDLTNAKELLRLFVSTRRRDLDRLVRDVGGVNDVDGRLTERQFKQLLLSLPVGLEKIEVLALMLAMAEEGEGKEAKEEEGEVEKEKEEKEGEEGEEKKEEEEEEKKPEKTFLLRSITSLGDQPLQTVKLQH